MGYSRINKVLIALLGLLLAAGPVFGATKKSGHKDPGQASAKPKTATKGSKKAGKKARRKARPRGQQAIDNNRARQIQEALIRANYLKGDPSGTWDQRTRDAMARFQADNGWQTKVLPDSRALIKLGLGPDHSNLINPETAATATASSGPARQQH